MVKANAKGGKRASNRARTDAEEAVDEQGTLETTLNLGFNKFNSDLCESVSSS